MDDISERSSNVVQHLHAAAGLRRAPGASTDELMTGAPVDRGLLGESRRRLDSRRLGAWLIDGILVGLLTTPLVLHYGTGLGTSVLIAALLLAYYFVFDVTSGQTIGKRVTRLRAVMADGSPLTERAASGRSVLLLVDSTLIGLAVYLLSRGRRRRIGDYAAGTIVCDVVRVGTFRRSFKLGDLGYPCAWILTGLVVFGLTATGHMPWSYRVRADHICAKGNAFLEGNRQRLTFADAVLISRQEEAILARMRPPANWRDRHRELLTRLHAENEAAMAVLSTPDRGDAQQRLSALQSLATADNVALTELGYRDCAGAEHTKTLAL